MDGLINKYIRYLEVERNASSHTITSYQNDLTSFHLFIAEEIQKEPEDVDVRSIDRLLIRLWLGKLSEDGMAKSSLARKVASVRSFFKFCFKRGHIDKNPAQLLVVPKKEKTLPKTVGESDISRMLDCVDTTSPSGKQVKAILEVFYGTGIRLSELVGMDVSHINTELKQIKVLGKGNKQRIVPLGSEAFNALINHLSDRELLFGKRTDKDARNAVFLAAGGQRIYSKAVQRIVEDHLKKTSEVTQKSPHVLRHSFATHMLNKGADIRVIKEFLGHANLAATQVYTHTSVDRLKNVYETAHPRAQTRRPS